MAQMNIISEKYDLNDKSYEFKTQLTCYDVRSGCYKVPEGEKIITNDIIPGIKFKVSYNQCMNLQLELIGVGIDECPIDVLILQVFQEKNSPSSSGNNHGSSSNGCDEGGGHWTGINVSNQRSTTKILKSVTIMSPDQCTISAKYGFKVPTIFIFKFIFPSTSSIFVSKCRKFSNHNYSHLFINDKSVSMSMASMSITSSSSAMKDNYIEEDNYADIEFMVEKKPIKGHKIILSSKSSVFRTLFWSKSSIVGNSSNSGPSTSMTRIDIPDLSYKSFYLFIKSLYSGQLESDNLKDSLELLRLSHKYNIIDLKRAAIEFIEELESNIDQGLNSIPGNGH